MRIGLEQAGQGFEQSGFFAVECASGDDEAQASGQRLEQTGRLGLLGGAHVEFQVASDRNALRQAAEGFEAFGVGLGLGEDTA